MPQRPLKPCNHPGCGVLTKTRHCPRHAGQRDYHRARGSSAARGYGANWRRLRLLVLNEEPICRGCRRAPSTDVDHIVPKSRGGTDDRSNLQGLCHECHSAKTVREDGGFGGTRLDGGSSAPSGGHQ